jgi:hypothetical protein
MSALPVVARVLSVSLEALFGESERGNRKRGPASRLQPQVDLIGQLPKTRQRFVLGMLDTVLAQSGR